MLALDVTDQASVDNATAEAVADAGGLDVVINNAGIAAIGVTEAFTPEQFEQIVAQIFNVPELAGSPRTEIATTRTI